MRGDPVVRPIPEKEGVMRLEIKDTEAELLRLLLLKELEETRVEMRHARNMDYKAGLEEREGILKAMLDRFAVPVH